MSHGRPSTQDVRVYFAEEVDQVRWPETPAADWVQKIVVPMMRKSSHALVANVRTRMGLIQLGELLLPFSVNEEEYDNSYVTSTYAMVLYAEEEIKRHLSRGVGLLLRPLLEGLKRWFRLAQVNKVVILNNALISTNLIEPIAPSQMALLQKALLERFPQHALLLRSLNPTLNGECLRALQRQRWTLVLSRSIYLIDSEKVLADRRRMRRCLRDDEKLFSQEGVEVVPHEELLAEDLPRIKRLYDQLYLEKYSQLNPQFTLAFFQEAWSSRSFTLTALRYHGELVGIVGWYSRGRAMTAPIFGYDTSLPQDLGLYRMLTFLTLQHAQETKTYYHLSAGAASFKRNRGATQELEYTAVAMQHLPLRRRLPWLCLKWVLNSIGKRIVVKKQL